MSNYFGERLREHRVCDPLESFLVQESMLFYRAKEAGNNSLLLSNYLLYGFVLLVLPSI